MKVEYSIDDLILYGDDQHIVINKPPGVPVQSDQSGDWNLSDALMGHVGYPVYLINRLDRPVSGAVLFALSKNHYHKIMNKWNGPDSLKMYVAIIEGNWKATDLIIEEKLKKGRNHKAIVHPEGKLSRMMVSSFPIYDRYSLCTVHLMSGRFHQIRALLSHHDHIIKGDVKYGARRKNQDRSIHLHCYQLKIHGIIDIKSPFPKEDVLWKKAEEFLLNKGF